MSRAGSADIAAWPVRRADPFSGAARMTTGTRSGMPNASRFITASWRVSGARPVPRARLLGYGLAREAIGVPRRIVEHAEAHPSEVRNGRCQEALGPDDAARIEDDPHLHPDHPFPLRRGAARPRGMPRYSRSGSPLGGSRRWLWPGKPPDRRCRDRRQRPPSRFPSIRAAGAHPFQILGFIERNRTHQPSWATQELRAETKKSVATPRLLRAENGHCRTAMEPQRLDPQETSPATRGSSDCPGSGHPH
jgi:hypothetical protein